MYLKLAQKYLKNLTMEKKSFATLPENLGKLSGIRNVKHYFPVYYIWPNALCIIEESERVVPICSDGTRRHFSGLERDRALEFGL